MSVEVVRKPPKPLPEEVARIWSVKRLSGVGEEMGGGKNPFCLELARIGHGRREGRPSQR